MKRRIALFLALAAGVLVIVSAGGAAPPFSHATGEIWMSGPSQHAEFAVFDYGATGDRGWFTYDNYEYAVDGGWLHYTADVICANVNASNGSARFAFQIPAGFPGLSGLIVGASITDDGSPGAGNDLYGHTVIGDAASFCSTGGAVGNYPITSGNLVVHTAAGP